MKVMYFHGFGSNFDPNNSKVKALEVLGEVVGFDIDYSMHPDLICERAHDEVLNAMPDLIVGTSMGGWLASHVGAAMGIPFVAVNPCLNPRATLREFVGEFVAYTGEVLNIEEYKVEDFCGFDVSGCGLILLDSADELFDSSETASALDNFYDVRMFEGGSHRFDHMSDSINIIKDFYDNSELVYGI